jgi:hypothetical protein
LPTTANAGSVVNECKTGAECVDLGFKYITGKDVKQDDFKALTINTLSLSNTIDQHFPALGSNCALKASTFINIGVKTE